jgi:hypothetical protein
MREQMTAFAVAMQAGSLFAFFRPRIKRITPMDASKRRTLFGLAVDGPIQGRNLQLFLERIDHLPLLPRVALGLVRVASWGKPCH